MFRFDPFSPEIDANPFPAYKTLRDEYPCFWSEEANMWVLTRYQDIVMALNDWETFSSAKGNLMSEMLLKKMISEQQWLVGLDSLLSVAEDLLVDIPKFWGHP